MKKKETSAARSVLRFWFRALLAGWLLTFIFGGFSGLLNWKLRGEIEVEHLMSVISLIFFLAAITCWLILEVNREQEERFQALESKLEALTQPEEPPQADTPEEL